MINDKRQIELLSKAFAGRLIPMMAASKMAPARIVDVRRGVKHITLSMLLTNPSDLNKVMNERFIDALALACNIPHVSAMRSEGLINLSFALPKQYHHECLFSQTTGRGIGVAEGNEQIEIDFPNNGAHCLIAAGTGGGKNVTLDCILLAMMRTEPNFELVAVDPQHQLTNFENCVQLVQPIAHSADVDIDRNINYTYQQFLKRQEMYPGGAPDDVPRLLFVLDEADIIVGGKGIRQKLIGDLGSGARKYRINLIILSQKPTMGNLGNVLANMMQRFVGLVPNQRISSDLLGHSGDVSMAHRLLGEGDFIHLLGGKVKRLQVGMTQPSDYEIIERSEKTFAVPAPVNEVQDITPDQYEAEKRPVGRPKRVIEPIPLAHFMLELENDSKQTYEYAKKFLGLPQPAVVEYRAYAELLYETLQDLRTGKDL